MKIIIVGTPVIIALLSVTAAADPAGTKGRDFDHLVFEAAADQDVTLTARVMNVSRSAKSASTIKVVSNGRLVFGSEPVAKDRWTQAVTIKGGGRQDVLLTCDSVSAAPVYCSLTLDGQARIVE